MTDSWQAIDVNERGSLTAVSSSDDKTIVRLVADPITGALLVSGASGSVAVYNETPGGLINGINATYTTVNNISVVIRITLNGEDIDPSQYTTSGSGFTMNTPIPASFSGTPFTIVYTSGTSTSTSFYADTVSGTINSSNTGFTVPNTITTPLVLFLSGVPYQPTVDFTTAGTNITMVTAPNASLSGQPFWLLHT